MAQHDERAAGRGGTLAFPRLDDPSFKRDPYPHYARLRAESPVHRASLTWWLPPIWIVTRYDDVVAVLKDDRLSKNYIDAFPFIPKTLRPIYRNLLTLDPPDHTRLRALVQKAFTPRLVERLHGQIQQWCDQLLEAAAGNREFDLIRDYAFPLPLTVIESMLGVPGADRPRFAASAKAAARSVSSARLRDFAASLPAGWRLMRYMRDLVERRRAEPRDDLLSALVEAEEEGDKLTVSEIVAMALLLLLAGFETTVHLIAGGALALLEHPDQRQQMLARPELTESAIEEILRYMSPVEFSTPRVAREDITIGSATIPKGALVAAALGSANHDESQFPDPEKFDITRDPNRHVAFGFGIHFCLGAPLARLEGEVALPALFRRFPNLRLAVPPDRLRWRPSVALRGLQQLPVTYH